MRKYFFILFFLLSIASQSISQERRIPQEQVPDIVMQAFRASYPLAKIRGTNIDIRDGKTFYEISSRDTDNTKRAILYTDKGQLEEMEQPIGIDKIPGAIKSAIAAKDTNDQIINAMMLVKPSGILYEVNIRNQKAYIQALYSPEGTLVKDDE